MHTYTIEDDTFLVYNDSLFKLGQTVSSITDLREDTYYLNQDKVGVFELQSESIPYSAFDAVFTEIQSEKSEYYTVDSGKGDEFESATQLKRVVPDQLAECPNCGAAAGDKTKENTPTCFNCGYNTETEA